MPGILNKGLFDVVLRMVEKLGDRRRCCENAISQRRR
jgi:hypothetical protein